MGLWQTFVREPVGKVVRDVVQPRPADTATRPESGKVDCVGTKAVCEGGNVPAPPAPGAGEPVEEDERWPGASHLIGERVQPVSLRNTGTPAHPPSRQ